MQRVQLGAFSQTTFERRFTSTQPKMHIKFKACMLKYVKVRGLLTTTLFRDDIYAVVSRELGSNFLGFPVWRKAEMGNLGKAENGNRRFFEMEIGIHT